MGNVIPMVRQAIPLARIEGDYVTAWSDYYRSARRLVDREQAIRLADTHVTYLKRRDAEIQAAVTAEMAVPQ